MSQLEVDQAEKLLEHPAFVRGTSRVREGLVKMLEQPRVKGQESFDDLDAEDLYIVNMLRALKSVVGAVKSEASGNKMKLAKINQKGDK